MRVDRKWELYLAGLGRGDEISSEGFRGMEFWLLILLN